MSLRIGIIVGSTRPGRTGKDVAEWYHAKVTETPDVEYEIVDLAEFGLPLLDEAMPAAMGQYQNEHTKAWAEKIASFDGYVWVTPEYNHSAPASLTNAISFIFNEWGRKPVAMVSYGSMGGVRAAEHLRAIAGELEMADIRLQVAIRSPWAMKDENGNIIEDLVSGNPNDQMQQLVWWAQALKTARENA